MIRLKSKLPNILKDRKMNEADLHIMLGQKPCTRLSLPSIYKISSEDVPATTSIELFAKAAVALGVGLDDVVSIITE